MKKTTTEIQVLVTVKIRHEALSKIEQRTLALGCIGKNSIGGAGEHGWYSAEVKSVKLKGN